MKGEENTKYFHARATERYRLVNHCFHLGKRQVQTSLITQEMMASAARVWNEPLFKEVMILAAWNIWKQRNRCYFDKTRPSLHAWRKMLATDLEILKFRVKPELVSYLDGLIATLNL